MTAPILPEVAALEAFAPPERQAAGGSRCRNCQAPLTGPYCAQCGQFDAPPDPTLRELLGDAWESITNVDGKILTSVKMLLVRPGVLTTEYLAGRRARYLPPFRLYLICSVVFFLVNAIDKPGPESRTATNDRARTAGSSVSAGRPEAVGDTTRPRGRGGAAGPTAFERRVDRAVRRLQDNEVNLKATIASQIPNAMFLLMPLYAALLAVIYRSRRRRYPTHLVFALHAHAFFFAALTVNELAEFVRPFAPTLGAGMAFVTLAGMFIHFPMAMRRVYGGRWIPTILRAVVLGNLYSLVALALVLAALLGVLFVMGA